ncbi:MAG TPA: hypothetical protein VFQ92_13495 [Blastocatellia bacterium]|nr:hypothetical protein [Blastocatellia bacterium]
MATKALTLGASRPVFDHPPEDEARGGGSDWISLLAEQDAQEIWNHIACIVRTVLSDKSSHPDQLTQDLFINLLATERFRFYLDNGFTDDEIKRDILSLILM